MLIDFASYSSFQDEPSSGHPSMPSSRLQAKPLLLSTFALLVFPTLINSQQFNCKHLRDDGIRWNLEKLNKTMTVHRLTDKAHGIQNITFDVNICDSVKPVSKSCPSGTKICAREYFYPKEKKDKDADKPEDEWPIAGVFMPGSGLKPLNPHIERMKNGRSHKDSKTEGLRVTIEGGIHAADNEIQKAVIEFECNRSREGTEGPSTLVISGSRRQHLAEHGDKDDKDKNKDKDKDKDKESDPPNLDEGSSLQRDSYDMEGDVRVLRLTWQTKHACEDQAENDDRNSDDGSKRSWGFFTWFIIIFFLAIASYLIFGSWLNYNRYGARGWDLLPHGDTIRDVPYLLKDWARSILGTMQSGGRRDLGYIRV